MKDFFSQKNLLLIIFVIFVVGVGGYLFYVSVPGQKDAGGAQQSRGWGDVQVSEQQQSDRVASSSDAQPTTSQSESVNANTALVDFANPETFEHPQRSFSFKYPGDLSVGQFDERGGEMVVVQDSNRQVGFQIFISPTDENISMSKARIQDDLPDLEVRDPQPVQLGDNTGQGLAFYSDNDAFGGDSREVWFTYDEYLYQISTYASQDPLLKQVLSSWTFR